MPKLYTCPVCGVSAIQISVHMPLIQEPDGTFIVDLDLNTEEVQSMLAHPMVDAECTNTCCGQAYLDGEPLTMEDAFGKTIIVTEDLLHDYYEQYVARSSDLQDDEEDDDSDDEEDFDNDESTDTEEESEDPVPDFDEWSADIYYEPWSGKLSECGTVDPE